MSKHLKRLNMPRSWALPRKTHVWVIKPSPGPHHLEGSLPLLVVLRDILGYCKNRKEGMSIISQRDVRIDGRVITNPKHPLGLMDVVSIQKTKESFRVLIDTRGKLKLVPIKDKDAKWKLVRVENKTTVKGGKTQINTHDGRNILPEKGDFRTGDVLKIEIPGQKIVSAYPLKEDCMAILIGGKHVGELGIVEKYNIVQGPRENLVRFKEGFSTVKKNVFVVGREKPEVSLPGT